MTKLTLAGVTVLLFSPLTGAFAQGSLSPHIPADNSADAASVVAGHGDKHRPFFYWLTGDGADAPAPAPAPAAAAAPVAPPPAPSQSVLKTGTSIGTK